jgi:hypothetical protein
MGQTVAVTKPAALPAEAGDLHPFRQAGNAYSKQSLLLFKDGTYTNFETDQKVTGTALAIMDEARHGWIRWWDRRPNAHRIVRVFDQPLIAPRDTLGDRDEGKWQTGLSGAKEDPWQHTIFLPLVLGDEPLTFTSRTFGGRGAFYALLKRYGWQGRQHPGQYPVIELLSETFHTQYGGDKQKPKFDITGWMLRPDDIETGDAGAELAAETAALPTKVKSGGDMDDEIPF